MVWADSGQVCNSCLLLEIFLYCREPPVHGATQSGYSGLDVNKTCREDEENVLFSHTLLYHMLGKEEAVMIGTCYRCDSAANHRITLKDGNELFCCDDHYNQWMCERLGHDYKQYAPPKTISVLDQRFKIAMQVTSRGVLYFAYRGRKGLEESWSAEIPFSMKRQDALEFLRHKISTSLFSISDDQDDLDEMGQIGVGYYNEFLGEEPRFIFKGRKITVEQLTKLLGDYQGYNLVYYLEPRVPHPDSLWMSYEEDILAQEGDDERER